jgi:NitT/TauT family transport system substrate-binding protein
MKRFAALTCLFLLPWSVPAASAQQLTKINLAYAVAADFLPVFVAKDSGIFEKHGLDVNLSVMGNPALAPAALTAGSLDISLMTPPNLLLANQGGLDMVAIAGVVRVQKTNPRSNLVTRTGTNITSPADLKGKKIGVPGINSSLDLVFKTWLKEHNVPLDQVTSVETPFGQMPDLLKSGQVDGVISMEPLLTRIVASGSGVRTFDVQSEVNPDFLGGFWGTTRDWATKHRPLVQEYRASLHDAMDFIAAHPDEAKAIEKKYIGYVDPSPLSVRIELVPADFEFWIKIATDLGQLHDPVDPAKLVFP